MKNVLVFLTWLLCMGSANATTTFVTAGTAPFDRSAWEAGLSGITTDTFSIDMASASTLNLTSGVTSVASDSGVAALPANHHSVSGGRLNITLRPTASTSPGWENVVLTFPFDITAFGADFYSIAGTRNVGPEGTFDAGFEHHDLRTLFIADGGLDQGFFGLKSTVPFNTVTLRAAGTGTNDSFTIDNLSFVAVPEPSSALFLCCGMAFACLLRKRR